MKHAFSPAAWRRMYLPRLFLLLAISLAADGLLLHIYAAGYKSAAPFAQSIGRIGLCFLAFVNLTLLKALPIWRYIARKTLLHKSYVQTGENVVLHYVQDTSMPRWKVESAAEMRLPQNGKTEYLAYNIYTISAAIKVKHTLGGSLCVWGTIDHEYVNEYEPETYGDEGTKEHHFLRKRHVIPGYYEQMEEVERELTEMMQG